MDDSSRIGILEQKVAELTKASDGTKPAKPKREKTNRPPSEYNEFMKKGLAAEKKEKGNEYDHKKAFVRVAGSWTDAKKK